MNICQRFYNFNSKQTFGACPQTVTDKSNSEI